ncbi:MAG: type I-E CRISPR-associated protein Cas5/CasD [Planctomycetes bacterium]|nr:type I-E CRISPR-associated protein Cas5/CasD [Planctomycetota bacterium]
MSTLLLRLAGPMQSWGTRSRFSNRDTGPEPSKSGVVGLLCAALGWPRDADTHTVAGTAYRLEGFARALPMGVRVDRPGRLMRDYHTAQEVLRASGKGTQETVLSERFYLADADFLVGLEGGRALLDALAAALQRPVWPVYLGRKSFVPSVPVCERIVGRDLRTALEEHPWRKRTRGDEPEGPLRCVMEVKYGMGEPRQDVAVSFVSRDRHFAVRHVADDKPITPKLVLEPDQELPDVPEQVGSQPA